MSYNAKNYTEQGGEKTVIGGELEILSGAKIKADEGAEVEGFGGSGGEYELPIATQDTLGGVKAGTSGPVRIDNDGVVYLTTAGCQAESEATDVEGLVSDFNALLAKLKTAGLMDTV